MNKKFICEECKFVWQPGMNKKLVNKCPICKSSNIRNFDENMIHKSSDDMKFITKQCDRDKSITKEYVVPWMIDI